MTELRELNKQLLAAIRDLDEALAELRAQAASFANAEREYRRSWAVALLSTDGRNADERAARAEQHRFATGDLSDIRYQRDLAEGLKGAASQAVKAKTQVISAIQSLSAAMREELHFAKYESDETRTP